MQAAGVIETSVTTGRSRRLEPAGADAFGAFLLDAQAAGALTSAAALSDATGLQPADDGDAVDGRGARIREETKAARQQEAQRSRADRAPAQSESSARLHESRSTDARQQATVEKASTGTSTRISPPSATGEHATTRSEVADDFADEAKPIKPQESQFLPDRPAQAAPSTREAGAERSLPTGEPAARPAIAVATAGAAKAAEAAATARSSPAEAVGRLLGGRVEAVRAPAPVQAGAQPGSDQAQARANPRSSQTQQGSANANAKESGGAESARRPDFLHLVRAMRANLGARESSATLRLDPPELGRMKVDVRMHGDDLHLRVEVASDRARDLLHGRIDDLASALREHDIRMEKVEIVTADPRDNPGQNGAQAFADARDASNEARQNASRPTRSNPVQSATEPDRVDAIEETINSAQLDLRI